MDRRAWRAIVHGVADLDMTELLTHTQNIIIGESENCFYK